jgi:hypothetical protein
VKDTVAHLHGQAALRPRLHRPGDRSVPPLPPPPSPPLTSLLSRPVLAGAAALSQARDQQVHSRPGFALLHLFLSTPI